MRIISFDDGFTSATAPTIEQAAVNVSVTPSGNLASTNVQAALVELQGDADALDTTLDAHIANVSNPHVVTKTQVGLSNVDNVQQIPLSYKGAVSGVAELDSSGKVPTSQLPVAVVGALHYMGTWNATGNIPALVNGLGNQGEYYVVATSGGTVLNGNSDWVIGDWVVFNGSVWEKIDNTDAVVSVAGRTGVVTLTSTDVGLANVDNTSDTTKNAATATLTNKTVTSVKVSDFLDVAEQGSAPSSPAAGYERLYAKTNGKVYKKNSSGTESELGAGAGGAGEKTYITNPSAATDTTGWAVSAGTLSRDTSASLPRLQTSTSGFSYATTASGQYAYTRFTLDAADTAKVLKIALAINNSAGGGWKVDVYKNTASDYSGSYTRIALDTDVSSVSALPTGTGEYNSSVTTDTTTYLELRIVSTSASAQTLYFSDVIVGPGKVRTGAALEDEYALTLTFNSFGTCTNYGTWARRVGNKLHVRGTVELGTVTASTASISLPSGLTIDSSKLSAVTNNQSVGFIQRLRSTGAVTQNFTIRSLLFYDGSDTAKIFISENQAGAASRKYDKAVASGSFVSTDVVDFQFELPISEWRGSGTLNTLQQDNLDQWQDVTLTGGWTTNSTYSGKGRRVGDMLEVSGSIALAGAPNAATLTINLPTFKGQTVTIDTSKVTSDEYNNFGRCGDAQLYDSGVTRYVGQVVYNGANSNVQIRYEAHAGVGVQHGGVNATAPITFGTSDTVNFKFAVPITQWAGNQSSLVGYSEVRPGVSSGLVSASGLKGATAGTAIATGYVGEALGSASNGTGGKLYSTTSTTTFSTETTVVSRTVNKGVYLVSACCSFTGPGTATNATWQLSIGGTKVTSASNQFITITASAENCVCTPTYPIVIDTDSTAVSLSMALASGSATNVLSELCIVRIA